MNPRIGAHERMRWALRARLGRWRAGRALVAAGNGLAAFAVAAAIAVGTDLVLALGRAELWFVGCAVLVVPVGLWAWGTWNAIRLDERAAALKADGMSKDPRRTVLSALELEREMAPGLRGWLHLKQVEIAAVVLARLEPGRFWPSRSAAWAWGRVGALVLAWSAAFAVWPEPIGMTLARFANPNGDLAPFTPLKLSVNPGGATVYYGDGLALDVTTSEPRPGALVLLETRAGERQLSVECYRAGPGHYLQRLERVVEPLLYRVVCGRARTPWHEVEVRMEPRAVEASLTLDPPAYTGLPPREVLVGSQPVEALIGTQVQMDVTSNRPLSGGEARFVNERGDETRIQGAVHGNNAIQFEWILADSGQVEVRLRDVTGTPSREPLTCRVRAVRDERPEVALLKPQGFSLATPKSRIAVEGVVSDDFGLARVEVVRALSGFRDRAQLLPVAPGNRQFEWNSEINLGQLGVETGQVLEVYLQAVDQNPTRTGVGASEPVRIKIIDEAEYERRLRERVTLEEVEARFQMVGSGFDELRRSLDTLRRDAASGTLEKADLERRRDEVATQAKELADLFDKLARDFPLFQTESDLNAALQETVQVVRKVEGELKDLDLSNPGGAADRLNEMLTAVGQTGERVLTPRVTEGLEAAKAARVAELAQTYSAVLKRQERLVRQLERSEGDTTFLPFAEVEQRSIREETERLIEDLRRAAAALPQEGTLGQLREDALAFRERLAGSGATTEMRDSEVSAANSAGSEASRHAREAAERLRQTKQESKQAGSGGGGSFADLCEGEVPSGLGSDALVDAMRRMLAGSRGRQEGGTGQGAGQGAGAGDPDDGYWTEGRSLDGVPLYGPERMAIRRADPQGASGQGAERGLGERMLSGRDRTEMGRSEIQTEGGRAQASERVPEVYRGAIQRYFQEKPETLQR